MKQIGAANGDDGNNSLTVTGSLVELGDTKGWKRKKFGNCRSLIVKNIPGQVGITVSPDGQNAVLVDAEDDFIKGLKISNRDGQVRIEGKPSKSSVSIKGKGINIGGINIRGRSTCIVGDNITIVNGRVIGGQNINISSSPEDDSENGRVPRMIILIPAGIGIRVDDVRESAVLDVCGKLSVDLSDECRCFVRKCSDFNADCSDGSSCEAIDITGRGL
ncbi:hypothetical protein ACFL16_03320 [Patescibacteria group bacterium]